MSDLEHSRMMLNMAEKDLKALKGMKDTQIFGDEIFGFHAQQAVEKSLKAWIAFKGEEYPLTHNISRLISILEDLNSDVGKFWDLVELNSFAVEFRYGSMETFEEPLDRLAVIRKVEEIFLHVQAIIGNHPPKK